MLKYIKLIMMACLISVHNHMYAPNWAEQQSAANQPYFMLPTNTGQADDSFRRVPNLDKIVNRFCNSSTSIIVNAMGKHVKCPKDLDVLKEIVGSTCVDERCYLVERLTGPNIRLVDNTIAETLLTMPDDIANAVRNLGYDKKQYCLKLLQAISEGLEPNRPPLSSTTLEVTEGAIPHVDTCFVAQTPLSQSEQHAENTRSQVRSIMSKYPNNALPILVDMIELELNSPVYNRINDCKEKEGDINYIASQIRSYWLNANADQLRSITTEHGDSGRYIFDMLASHAPIPGMPSSGAASSSGAAASSSGAVSSSSGPASSAERLISPPLQNYDREDGDRRPSQQQTMMPAQVPSNAQTALLQEEPPRERFVNDGYFGKGQGKGGNEDMMQEPGSAQEGLGLNDGYVGKGQGKGGNEDMMQGQQQGFEGYSKARGKGKKGPPRWPQRLPGQGPQIQLPEEPIQPEDEDL